MPTSPTRPCCSSPPLAAAHACLGLDVAAAALGLDARVTAHVAAVRALQRACVTTACGEEANAVELPVFLA